MKTIWPGRTYIEELREPSGASRLSFVGRANHALDSSRSRKTWREEAICVCGDSKPGTNYDNYIAASPKPVVSRACGVDLFMSNLPTLGTAAG